MSLCVLTYHFHVFKTMNNNVSEPVVDISVHMLHRMGSCISLEFFHETTDKRGICCLSSVVECEFGQSRSLIYSSWSHVFSEADPASHNVQLHLGGASPCCLSSLQEGFLGLLQAFYLPLPSRGMPCATDSSRVLAQWVFTTLQHTCMLLNLSLLHTCTRLIGSERSVCCLNAKGEPYVDCVRCTLRSSCQQDWSGVCHRCHQVGHIIMMHWWLGNESCDALVMCAIIYCRVSSDRATWLSS